MEGRTKALRTERRINEAVFTPSDKWNATRGAMLMIEMQTIVRVLLAQSALDRSRGVKTEGYVPGYRESLLGSIDTAL